MCSFLSPYDPVFFAHHAMVDKIWKDWQDAHLDTSGNERFWSDSDPNVPQIPVLMCNGNNGTLSPTDTIPASEVEVSTHMIGSMNGAVNYFERGHNFQCGDDWEKIQCCMIALQQSGCWKDVARLSKGDEDVSDICSPMNGDSLVDTQHWLETMRDGIPGFPGHLTQDELDRDMNITRQERSRVNQQIPKIQASEWESTTDCEKSLCMAITTGDDTQNVKGVCQQLQHDLPDADQCWPVVPVPPPPPPPTNCNTFVAVDIRATDDWCRWNCNQYPSYCPEAFCERQCGSPAPAPPPSPRDCRSKEPSYIGDFWCFKNCNHIPENCPPDLCRCGFYLT